MTVLNNPVTQTRGGFKRVLNAFDMDALHRLRDPCHRQGPAASAKVGVLSISWWIITFVFCALRTYCRGNLAAYPGEGGIQQWIRRALGDKWAGRTVWYYWVNVALWMPSVYILFAGMFAQLFAPEMKFSG